VLIVGDFTARIGDPSGRSETRPMLSEDEIRVNADTYLAQAGKVIDVAAAELHGNAEWLAGIDMEEVIRLTSSVTLAQMLERDDFRDRYQGGRAISVVELLYPLLQGYDSVAVRADVELGGTDQTFNLLMGREVQRAYGQEPQVVLTLPLLEGTDGVRKMSKSLDNYIGLTEPPDDMFGKLMRIPDGLIAKYFLLAGPGDPDEAAQIERALSDGTLHPNDAKRRLAREIVDRYHGDGEGRAAEERFSLVHRDREIPADVADVAIPEAATRDGRIWLPRLLVELGRARSNGEARRLIEQGGVRLDGEPLRDPDRELAPEELKGRVLQVGRRWFGRLG
jgi:tyrosyl-tRNA synthetase